MHPQGADWLGYLAAVLVFCSFYAKTIVVLRLVAITSNMAFIGYAAEKGLYPVLVLHAVLLPLNCFRLAQLRARDMRRCISEKPSAGSLINRLARPSTSRAVDEGTAPARGRPREVRDDRVSEAH